MLYSELEVRLDLSLNLELDEIEFEIRLRLIETSQILSRTRNSCNYAAILAYQTSYIGNCCKSASFFRKILDSSGKVLKFLHFYSNFSHTDYFTRKNALLQLFAHTNQITLNIITLAAHYHISSTFFSLELLLL